MKGEVIQSRITRLRKRLVYFPVDYEFFVMNTVRELLNWCSVLVSTMAMHRESVEVQGALLLDLYAMVLQGVCLGVEALGWHGYGFDSTCGRSQTCKVLATIRERGSIGKRDLLRDQQWLKADSRDRILTAFEGEGIVRVTGHEVIATPFTDYWAQVCHRVGTDLPERMWKADKTKFTTAPVSH